MSWSKEQVLGFMAEETRLGRLATVSADGDPHVVPIWFAVGGDRLHIHTQAGVTVSGRAKVVGNEVVDSIALVKQLAVAHVGPEGGPSYGEFIANMPGEHVTLVLHVDQTQSWDYS
jgi:hypothetical protein